MDALAREAIAIMTSEAGNFHDRETKLDADALDEQRKHYERQTALLFAMLIGVLSGTGIILEATRDRQPAPSSLSDCASIEPQSARLGCFDELSRRAEPEPFKGAPPVEMSGRK